ncbi:hypothetical protein EDB92DRAFT_1945289 [Lactarius akahatsu]|uniref:Uncharacterized protein n=1 Tax=Lactarius akahatsu TaxID=416441 RepID=A0AAD4LL95_9AGAM|nr:hypothetical protein EDB92DRAFT_1945289 [Lactarius akahatsu]
MTTQKKFTPEPGRWMWPPRATCFDDLTWVPRRTPPLGKVPTLGHEAEVHDFFHCPSRANTLQSRRSGAPWPTKSASPFYPGLDDDATFGSKSFLRSKLVRSLRGSTSGSTERPAAEQRIPQPEDLTRLNPDQHPVGGGKGVEGLSTVVEEDLEDWVDDFDDVPLGVGGADPDLAAGSSQTQTQLTHESDSAFASQARPRTTSKTSKRSRRSSSRNTDLRELRLILDFPLPPTFIPTPNSKTPISVPVRLPQQQATSARDDGSILDDHDPSDLEVVSVIDADAGITRVGSSASFYTAHSQSPSPVPSVQSAHTGPPPSPPPSVHPPPLSPLHLPFPNPSPSPSPQQPRTETPSTTHRSIKTFTKASATLKRFGNLTRETLRTSFRTPGSELSVRRTRRATTRVAHVSLDQLHQPSLSLPNAERSPLLPDFHPEAFDISFPAVETPHATPRISRLSRTYPSVHSFYASLEEFLTSHLHSDDTNNRRSRFISAPTLLLTTERDTPKPPTSPPAVTDTQPVTPTPPPHLPRPDRPLPPLPRESYDFVDPSTLTESASVSPISEYRYSSIPPSPSWLSRNVRELEISLAKKVEAASLSSSRSACGSDTEYASTIHRQKATQAQSSSSSTISSPVRLRGEVVLLRGRVNIQDSIPRHITLRTLSPSSRTPSEATVIQPRSRPRRNRSVRSNQPRLVTAVPPNSAVRPRSRSSSVTKATITHYRRSLVENRKKSRPHHQKESPTKLSPRAQVPKACFFLFLLKCQS